MTDISIRVVAIPTEIAAAVRNTGKAPHYGHPAHREVATGSGPCRHCLKTFVKGEDERILFTYDPFQAGGNVPLPGPIFVHAEDCERYPEDAGYPKSLREFSSVITAFGDNQRILSQTHVDNGDHPMIVQQLLVNPDARYLHIRDRMQAATRSRIERAVKYSRSQPNKKNTSEFAVEAANSEVLTGVNFESG